MNGSFFEKSIALLDEVELLERTGRVEQVIGLVLECSGMALPVGSICEIDTQQEHFIRCEVVGFREERLLLMPLGFIQGIKRGDRVRCVTTHQKIGVSRALLGRVLDADARPLDQKPMAPPDALYGITNVPPHPLTRQRIREPIVTGVRCIDALMSCGQGQRMGLFSGSGVGKSTLLGMIARNTSADVNVIALVGERGREVREFIEKDLGPEGLSRSVVIVATSDQPALLRVKAPFTASAIAEYFRDQGLNVLLMMDSITRMANAQREIGLSAGEPPATKGYPPSVFAMMPRLLERAGCAERGSITGMYTILVEADDMNEPIADTARSILDGHIWLSRSLAIRGHYPAVDPLTSISRLMIDVVDPRHMVAANRLKAVMSVYKESEDLINIGAYVKGSNPEIDTAVRMMPEINRFLRQGIGEKSSFPQTVEWLMKIEKDMGNEKKS